MIEIYTDGSTKGNGKKHNHGGWGIVVLYQEQEKINLITTISAQEEDTTNNKMEIKALLSALDLATNELKEKECVIKSDSAYCVNMFNEWIRGWARNNWITSAKQPVKNLDLVKELYKYSIIDFPNFSVERVSGHCGNVGNELADALATNDQDKFNKILKENKNIVWINISSENIFDFFKKI